MSNTLDPRMIDKGIPFVVSSAYVTSLTAQEAIISETNVNNLSTDNLISNNSFATNFTATGNVVSNFFILTADNDYTFTEQDNSKIYHFNTTLVPIITATLPSTLPNGFNVGIVNVGSGAIVFSSIPPLNAAGNINTEQYTSVFIYKHNGMFYGVGNFE
jgi:hypothetical protein